MYKILVFLEKKVNSKKQHTLERSRPFSSKLLEEFPKENLL